MPHAEAIHSNEASLATNAILSIIATDKHRQRQSVLLNNGNRNAAVPPCSIHVVPLPLGRRIHLVVNKIFEQRQTQLRLATGKSALLGHVADVFPLILANLVVQHCTANHIFTMFRLENTQQIVSTLDAFGRNCNIIIHKQDIRSLWRLLHRSNHAAGETSSSANIIVRNDLDTVSVQLFSIQGTPIVHHIHMEMFCN